MKFTLVTAFSLLLLCGCSKPESGTTETTDATTAWTIAVIPKGTTHEFWKSINAGAFKARDELAAHILAQAKRRAERDDRMFDY